MKTKSLIRSYFWWPNIDKDVEIFIKSCNSCLHTLPSPLRVEVDRWEKPDGLWSKIHIDYARPSHGYRFLVIVDSFSKWIEVFKMKTI